MTDDKILDIFQAHGQYATGKDYAMIHAIAEAVSQQRKPLTDEQFQAIKDSLSRQEGWDGEGWAGESWDLALKKAIEAAHNIKE